ncbi:MAG: FAD-binding oxidoreductase [Candidatus Omnitrophota bacterium]|nr:FAD-binding oxidoreductase [Candidatus Omnitrophota bacterium]
MLIKKDQDSIESYFEDSSNLKGGHADSVVFPENIEDLSEFVKKSNIEKTPITISGGGTSVTGSRIPFGGVVISLEKFNKIIDVSGDKMRAVALSGVLVEDFKKACEDKGLFYACHPTEKSAFLGGTVSTNASGARSFKYGSTRRHVKRLKMVLATGQIFEIERGQEILTGSSPIIPIPTYKMPRVKNSAGYFAGEGTDYMDLFIGQEGTLSIITEAELALSAMPHKIFSSFVFFKDEKDSWSFAEEARRSDALSIEYFDSNALRLLKNKSGNVPGDARAAIFFEQELTEDGEESILDGWVNTISKHNASLDSTWVAMTECEADKFNQFRYSIPESVNEIVRSNGFRKLSADIAVPESGFSAMVNFYTDTLKAGSVEHVIFGHIGECHLHVNLLPRNEKELKISEEICLAFVKKGVHLGGTVSAEHGIGKTRHKYLEEMYGRRGILEMARIKKAIDPNCILGLDNIFPKEILGLV